MMAPAGSGRGREGSRCGGEWVLSRGAVRESCHRRDCRSGDPASPGLDRRPQWGNLDLFLRRFLRNSADGNETRWTHAWRVPERDAPEDRA